MTPGIMEGCLCCSNLHNTALRVSQKAAQSPVLQPETGAVVACDATGDSRLNMANADGVRVEDLGHHVRNLVGLVPQPILLHSRALRRHTFA